MDTGPQISVAICTWNRCAQLAETLESLTHVDQPTRASWEVVVVNNASSDDTSAVINTFTNRLPIREVREPRPGASHARNRALTDSLGAVVAFVDDDVRVGHEWLTTYTRLEREYPNAAIFAGPVCSDVPISADADLLAASPYLRKGFCALDHQQPEGVLRNGLLPVGANMGLRRAGVRHIRFATSLGPVQRSGGGHEDNDIVRRIYARGGQAIWSPRLTVQHCVDPSRMTLSYVIGLECARARTRIRASAPPRGLTLGGVPVSTLAGTVAAHLGYGFWQLTSQRRRRLLWQVRSHRFRAKVSEYRAMRRHIGTAEDARPAGVA